MSSPTEDELLSWDDKAILRYVGKIGALYRDIGEVYNSTAPLPERQAAAQKLSERLALLGEMVRGDDVSSLVLRESYNVMIGNYNELIGALEEGASSPQIAPPSPEEQERQMRRAEASFISLQEPSSGETSPTQEERAWKDRLKAAGAPPPPSTGYANIVLPSPQPSDRYEGDFCEKIRSLVRYPPGPPLLAQRRKAVLDAMLKSLPSGNVTGMTREQLHSAIRLIDEEFLGGSLSRQANFEVDFSGKSHASGDCRMKSRVPCTFVIRVSLGLFEDLFGEGDPPTENSNGITCTSQLACLLVTLEHEMTHAIIGICYRGVKPHGDEFKSVVKALFGHTDIKHSLGLGLEEDPAEYRRKLKRILKPGDVVLTKSPKGEEERYRIISILSRDDVRRFKGQSLKDGKVHMVPITWVALPPSSSEGAKSPPASPAKGWQPEFTPQGVKLGPGETWVPGRGVMTTSTPHPGTLSDILLPAPTEELSTGSVMRPEDLRQFLAGAVTRPEDLRPKSKILTPEQKKAYVSARIGRTVKVMFKKNEIRDALVKEVKRTRFIGNVDGKDWSFGVDSVIPE